MRMNTVLRKLLSLASTIVRDFELAAAGLIVSVAPTWRRSRCSGCGQKQTRYDRLPARTWKHLAFGRLPILLSYAPWRVDCPSCGVRVELVPWAHGKSSFTQDFEELAAYLAQSTDQTKVAKLLGISWPTVGGIIRRVVDRQLHADRFEKLRRIGIDEFSYRKRHRYLTVVVDHDRRRVIWAGEGRSAKTLQSFFSLLTPTQRSSIKLVTMDMAAGYQKAVAESLPKATIVFDRFHVQRLAADALDEVRRAIVRGSRGTADAKHVKGLRFTLLRGQWNLEPEDHLRLAEVRRTNKPLYRAYLLKEMLDEALNCEHYHEAAEMLRGWLAWASRSRLAPFVKAARTIRKHLDGILAYVHSRLTNGLVEGFNNKLRVVARRAFGFHSPQALIAMLFLVCGGIQLDPPLPKAGSS